MCVTPHALLSALARRIADEGYLVTAGDVDALLGARCPVEDVARAFAAPGDAFAHARAVLAARRLTP